MEIKIKPLYSVGKLFVWIFLICILLGCTIKNTATPIDMPLPEFIIGEWKVISRVDTDTGRALEIAFPKVSIYRDELSYGDAYRAKYNFIGEDIIFVDNKRLIGGETWRLERDGEHLIVYQEFQYFKSTIRLERVAR
jgi:hypothetical protein